MAAKISVLRLILSSFLYLRSRLGRLPLIMHGQESRESFCFWLTRGQEAQELIMNTTGVSFIERTLLQMLLLYSGPSIYVTFSRVGEDLDRVRKNELKSLKTSYLYQNYSKSM